MPSAFVFFPLFRCFHIFPLIEQVAGQALSTLLPYMFAYLFLIHAYFRKGSKR